MVRGMSAKRILSLNIGPPLSLCHPRPSPDLHSPIGYAKLMGRLEAYHSAPVHLKFISTSFLGPGSPLSVN